MGGCFSHSSSAGGRRVPEFPAFQPMPSTRLMRAHGQTGWRLGVKAFFDRTIAFLGLVLLSPIFLVVSLLILVSVGRPIYFRQRRPGRHARPFTLLKFRTM